MNLIIIVGIAIFLSLDSFSVALTAGSINEKSSKRQWFFISLLFGISQFIAMILGFNIKLKCESIVLTLSYAVAFVVFLLFGIANFYNFFSLVKKEKEIALIKNKDFYIQRTYHIVMHKDKKLLPLYQEIFELIKKE